MPGHSGRGCRRGDAAQARGSGRAPVRRRRGLDRQGERVDVPAAAAWREWARMTNRAVIAFGSNLGDRLAYIQGGVDALLDTPGTSYVAQSQVYETDPVGGPEQPPFLNAVVIVDTALSPPALLERAHAIEEAFERARVEHWGPRTLDVDIVAVGDLVH